MLKGHTKIELTNVNTGEVNVYENDNMFTNAISESLNNGWVALVGGYSALNSWHLPLSQKLMGGIALFENTIEEDVTNSYFPESNNLIGFSGTSTSNGKNNKWGSRNIAESQIYDTETKSVKHVWDFATSEGNGTISCVGLIDGGQGNGFCEILQNLDYTRYLDVTSYFSCCGRNVVEFEGDECVEIVNGTGKVTINTYEFNFNTAKIENTIGQLTLIDSKEVQMPLTDVNYVNCSWKNADDYWYGFLMCSNNNFTAPLSQNELFQGGTKYLQIIRINKSTYDIDYHDVQFDNYVHPASGNYLITKKYIIVPFSTYSSFTGRNGNDNGNGYISKTSVYLVNLEDWTITLKDFVDENENTYTLPHSTLNSYQLYTGQLFTGGFQTAKLPNGQYCLNGLILNDECVVLKQIDIIVSSASNATLTAEEVSTYTNAMRISTIPFALNAYATHYTADHHGTTNLILNKSKGLILWVGYQNSNLKFYIMPLLAQKLITINNLDSPVTKTSEQSMKITYTITEA